MKAQIGVRITPLNGYLNLDAATQNNEKDRVACDPMNIDPLVDHNELDEFIINDILDYLPLPARQKCLNHLLTKVSHQGKVVITGINPYEVSRLVHNGQLDIQQANSIIYGIGRKSFVNPVDNVQMALSTGQFLEDGIKYDGFKYVIQLIRK